MRALGGLRGKVGQQARRRGRAPEEMRTFFFLGFSCSAVREPYQLETLQMAAPVHSHPRCPSPQPRPLPPPSRSPSCPSSSWAQPSSWEQQPSWERPSSCSIRPAAFHEGVSSRFGEGQIADRAALAAFSFKSSSSSSSASLFSGFLALSGISSSATDWLAGQLPRSLGELRLWARTAHLAPRQRPW